MKYVKLDRAMLVRYAESSYHFAERMDDSHLRCMAIELLSLRNRDDEADVGRVVVDVEDRPLPEDAAIDAAFPTRSGRHDLYADAMRMVGARYSKAGLVALVNWLLVRSDSFLPGSKKSSGERASIVSYLRVRADSIARARNDYHEPTEADTQVNVLRDVARAIELGEHE